MNVVILAAGMGKRMQSQLPKVLHKVAGKAMLVHVLETAIQVQQAYQVDEARKGSLNIVYGHGGEQVPQAIQAIFPNVPLNFVKQEPQLGTGHAVAQAIPYLKDEVPTLVLYGDVPLTCAETLSKLVTISHTNLAILTANMDKPKGLGRIVRDSQNAIVQIVEEKDASEAQRAIQEINTGMMVLPTPQLKTWLGQLSNHNAQGEYYLTDVVAMAVRDGVPITSAQPQFIWETLGVNSKVQLAELERVYQSNLAQQLLEQGVTLYDPARIDIRGKLTCGKDVVIDVGCVFEGEVTLADGVHIEAHCVIKNTNIGSHTHIKAFTHIENAEVGQACHIGPYARLRLGTQLAEDVHIGNFVETKNTQIAAHSKANHLTYLGDAEIGRRVNVGAGTITCNYDGANKFKTIIEDDAFIGSDSQLIAPIRVGKGATLGAGTTLSKDAPEGKLTVSRPKQMTIEGWQRPVKPKK